MTWKNPIPEWGQHDNATVDETILHQLIDGKHPMIYKVSTVLLVAQDFATIHSLAMLGLELRELTSKKCSIHQLNWGLKYQTLGL